MSIPAVQGHPLFTTVLQTKWDELASLKPTGFLRSFFTKKTTASKSVQIAVRRGTEKVAVDVVRGSEGNRNEIRQHNIKEYIPPLYKEYFDATDIDHYDVMFGNLAVQNNVSDSQIIRAVESAMNQSILLKDKIERAIELQCSQALFDGIVQLNNGDNIDYNRKSASFFEATAADYWTNQDVDPGLHLKNGALFLKKTGRVSRGTFNVFMGEDALVAYLTNPKVLERADSRRISRLDIGMPQEMGDGAIFHGQDSYGDYKFNLWSYPQYYDNASAERTPYIPATKFLMLPDAGPLFDLSFAGVPHLVATGNDMMPQIIQNIEGDYHMFSTVDDRAVKHEFGVQSAPLAILTKVDYVYSGTVVAAGGNQG